MVGTELCFSLEFMQKKKWPDSWADKLDAFNFKHFVNPFRHDEITKFRKDNKDYGFKCSEEPMCNHCDKQLCRTRKYGIGTQSLFPQLSDLQIIELDPKIFRLNVDGERVELKAEELQEQRLFVRACMNQIHKFPPTIKPKDYKDMVALLMANPEIIEAPTGATKLEQLAQHLENYCTSRTAEGATKEDMESGNVWNKDLHHHFIFTHFYHKFLHRHKWTEKYDITILWLLEHCNCEHIRMNIGKKKLSVIKIKQFEKEQMKIKERKFKKEDAF